MQLSDYLFRMGTDTVDWPGTIDKGYFYSEVWLEGKYNDYYTCIILKGFLLPSALHIWWLALFYGCVIVPVLKALSDYYSQIGQLKR